MSQSYKAFLVTIPLALIHIAAIIGIIGASVMLMGADMRLIEGLPIVGSITNSPKLWALTTLAMPIIAVATNPMLYVSPTKGGFASRVSDVVGSMAGLMVPVLVGLAVIASPIFLMLGFTGGGVSYIAPYVAVASLFLLTTFALNAK